MLRAKTIEMIANGTRRPAEPGPPLEVSRKKNSLPQSREESRESRVRDPLDCLNWQ
jgi:hypothetical protein